MPRYKLTIEYDGAPFAGWQRQDNAPSVQEELEKAAQKLDQSTVTVQGAGRTDSGVHALGQVAHIDLTKDLAEDKVRDALNYHLKPNPVAVLEAERVSLGHRVTIVLVPADHALKVAVLGDLNLRLPATLSA